VDIMESTDVRQRAVAVIQEAGTLLQMIPQLLDKSEVLKTNLDTVSKEADGFRKEVAALRVEVQQVKTEREEMSDGLTVIMNEILRLTTDAVALLRPSERRSSFRREGSPSTGDGAPARAAATASGLAWKRDG
jgi:uncharacterized coiled-coil DUF342 family protein